MFKHVEGVEVVEDDLLIWGWDDIRLKLVPKHARHRNLKLNQDKSLKNISYIDHRVVVDQYSDTANNQMIIYNQLNHTDTYKENLDVKRWKQKKVKM